MKPEWVMKANKTMFKIHTRGVFRRPAGGDRGVIQGYSVKSRRRFFEWLHQLDWQAMGTPAFITLTFGQEWPDPREGKVYLKALWRKLEAAGGRSMVWRMEFQKRGAVHFHGFYWGLRIDKEDLTRMWGEVLPLRYHDTTTGLPPFTRIEAMRTAEGAMWYASKYMTKGAEGFGVGSSVSEAPPNPRRDGFNSYAISEHKTGTFGRFWGCFGASRMVRDEMREVNTMPFNVASLDAVIATGKVFYGSKCLRFRPTGEMSGMVVFVNTKTGGCDEAQKEYYMRFQQIAGLLEKRTQETSADMGVGQTQRGVLGEGSGVCSGGALDDLRRGNGDIRGQSSEVASTGEGRSLDTQEGQERVRCLQRDERTVSAGGEGSIAVGL